MSRKSGGHTHTHLVNKTQNVLLVSFFLLLTLMEKDNAQDGHAAAIEPYSSAEGHRLEPEKGDVLAACEVFHETSEGVNFRTVSWQRATVLFLKIQFAMSILAVPSALGTLGAVGGALSIVGWQVLNTCTANLWTWISMSQPCPLVDVHVGHHETDTMGCRHGDHIG